MLPQYENRADALARIGKDYWRSILRETIVLNESEVRDPTEDEIIDAYAKWGPFQDHHVAGIMALRFKRWYEESISAKRSAAGRISAAKKSAVDSAKKLKKKL